MNSQKARAIGPPEKGEPTRGRRSSLPVRGRAGYKHSARRQGGSEKECGIGLTKDDAPRRSMQIAKKKKSLQHGGVRGIKGKKEGPEVPLSPGSARATWGIL